MARSRRPRAWWAALIERFEKSGSNAAEFAAANSVGLDTFRWWRTQLRGQRRLPAPMEFVEMVVEHPEPTASPPDPFVVVVGEPHRVIVPAGFDARELRRLVAALC